MATRVAQCRVALRTPAASLDHLVCGGEQFVRNGEAERPGGLEVDGEFALGWRLHWKVGGLLTFEDAIDVAGPAPVLLDRIRSVGDQAAAGDVKALPVDCGQF